MTVTKMDMAGYIGKRCLMKLIRMGAMTYMTAQTGGLGAIPIIMEVFDGSIDVIDTINTVKLSNEAIEFGESLSDFGGSFSDTADVEVDFEELYDVIDSGVKLSNDAIEFGESVSNFNGSFSDIADGEVDFEELYDVIDSGAEVVSSFDELMDEVNSFKNNAISKTLPTNRHSAQVTKPHSHYLPAQASETVLSVAGNFDDLLKPGIEADRVESMVFSSLRQTQVLSTFGAVAHVGTWYGLHTLNTKINRMEREIQEQNEGLILKIRGEIESGFQTLGLEIYNGFQEVHAKLDRLNRKFNHVHGVSKLKKFLTDFADAESMEMFVSTISRGDIIECEQNLLLFVDDFLDDKTDKNWHGGLLQLGYVVKAYELEFAWLVAKGTDKYTKLLPLRLEEGAHRLGNLIGQFILEITRRKQHFSDRDAELLLSSAASLSDDYSRIFAPPENQNLSMRETDCLDDAVCDVGRRRKIHPRRSSAEAFLAIGDISIEQKNLASAESSYTKALAFDPFYDPTWMRIDGRLCGLEGDKSLISCKENLASSGIDLAMLSVKKYAVEMEMSKKSLALPSTDNDRQESHLQGLLLLVDIFHKIDDAETTDRVFLESLLLLSAGLLSSSMERTKDKAFAPLLVVRYLLKLAPTACLSSVIATTGMIDLFEATTNAALLIDGIPAVKLLATISEECLPIDSLPKKTYERLVTSLIDAIKYHHEDEKFLIIALKLLAVAAQDRERWEPFGPRSIDSIKIVLNQSVKSSELESTVIVAGVCEVVSNFTREGQTWANHELGGLIRHFCESASSESITECCQILYQVDHDADLDPHGNRIEYSDSAHNHQPASRNCVEKYGRKRYAGDMTMTIGGEHNGWEPNGRGNMEWNDGSLYQGHWESNVMSGVGTLRIGSGGTTISNIDPCEGTYFEQGTIVRGDFRDGVLNGKGVIVFPNRKVFVGAFEDGLCIATADPADSELVSSTICFEGRIVDADEGSSLSYSDRLRSWSSINNLFRR